jgi:hypothetical protein
VNVVLHAQIMRCDLHSRPWRGVRWRNLPTASPTRRFLPCSFHGGRGGD